MDRVPLALALVQCALKLDCGRMAGMWGVFFAYSGSWLHDLNLLGYSPGSKMSTSLPCGFP
jgi:hypothetical protein